MLIGSGTLLQGLIDVAKKSFEVEVVYGDPFKKVEAPAFSKESYEMRVPLSVQSDLPCGSAGKRVSSNDKHQITNNT